MFGGTTNNLVVLMVKPDKPMPENTKVYWKRSDSILIKASSAFIP